MARRGLCGKCGHRRSIKKYTGPGLPEKGEDLCRPCHQAYKLVVAKIRKAAAEKLAAGAMSKLAVEIAAEQGLAK